MNYGILRKPVLSEKTNNLRDQAGRYVFKVDLKASKNEIASAVELMFGVKVTKVRTLITRGKLKRRGQKESLGSKTKKAYITLVEGAKIALFEDQ